MGHCTVFVCPATRGELQADPNPPQPRQDPPVNHRRPGLLKWIVSLLACCLKPRCDHDNGDTDSGNKVEIGPMTLREYVETLEPYDPQVHGWRGDEPRRKSYWQANGVASTPASQPQYGYNSVSYHSSDNVITLQRNKFV